MSAPVAPSRRVLQIALVAAAVLAVLVGDRAAVALLRVAGAGSLTAALSVGAHLTAGVALGLALRLQLPGRPRPDPGARILLGIPIGLVAATPILLGLLPGGVAVGLPAWVLALQPAAPFAGAALGVVLTLGVGAGRR